MITYPLAGRLGASIGLGPTFLLIAAVAALGMVLALRLWPASEPDALPHNHADLPPDHPHLREHGAGGHSHALVIDDLHRHWPQANPAR